MLQKPTTTPTRVGSLTSRTHGHTRISPLDGGRNAFLGVKGMTPLQGGLPIMVDNKLIGAIGVSGVTSQQDEQIARVGLEALGK